MEEPAEDGRKITMKSRRRRRRKNPSGGLRKYYEQKMQSPVTKAIVYTVYGITGVTVALGLYSMYMIQRLRADLAANNYNPTSLR